MRNILIEAKAGHPHYLFMEIPIYVDYNNKHIRDHLHLL